MSEQQGDYITQEEIDEAMDMLGKGYEAPYEIHMPSRVISEGEEGQQEYQAGVWVKITASFRNKHLKRLKGSRLGVWLCIALHINENNDSHPSIETICKETGYSNREVIDCVRELEKDGYLTVIRGKARYNIYHVNFGAAYGKGNNPTSEESSQVKLGAGNSELSSKKVLKSSLKEEPIKKNQKRGDLVDAYLDLAQSPGIKRTARIDNILSYLGSKLQINTETKRWKDFAKFADDRQQTRKENIDVFVSWLIGQKNFDIQFWPPSKMQEMWPQAFQVSETARPEYQPISSEDRSQYVPRPANIPRPVTHPAATIGD